jgi:hypothetical protein
MLRRNREINIFSLSAIDLFCSGMGAVMVLMVLLMPYYRKQLATPPPVPLEAAAVPLTPVPVPVKPAPPVAGVIIHDLELMIVIDTTGSMGRQIDDLRNTLGSIVNVLCRLSENLRVGVVAYRDHGDEYVVRTLSLRRVSPDDSGMTELREFIRGLGADGGGDLPEAVAEAMEAATHGRARWTSLAKLPTNSRQIILIVADAPGHDPRAHKASAIAKAWQTGDARRGVFCATPGMYADYFRPLAEAGNGRLVGWTDMLGTVLDVVIDRR